MSGVSRESSALMKLKSKAVDIIEEKQLEDLLNSGKKLRIKIGIDPTAPLVHIGHLVLILKIREFQELGHQAYVIVGDFTAKVGDPSGRSSLRPRLSDEEIEKNTKIIMEKFLRFLDKNRTQIYFNSDWLSNINLSQIIDLSSKVTVSQILGRDDFRKRQEEGKPLYVHEFLYPLLQAYDSVVITADIELGGTDQLFNLLLGREMMKSFGLPPQVCITLPLLEGLDGKLKMSKSYGNYISVDDKAEDIYGKIMGIPDELITKYAKLLCNFEEKEIEELKKIHPFEAKSEVALRITELLKGKEEAEKARQWFNKVIRMRGTPDEIPEFEVSYGTILQKVLKELGVVKSVSEATRLTESGGIYINGEQVKEKLYQLKKGEYVVRVGKTKFIKLRVKEDS